VSVRAAVNRPAATLLLFSFITVSTGADSVPVRARGGMVVSQERIAAGVGARILREGGNAVDAAVAAAFALAVTFPFAGNLGGGGFLVFRPASGEPASYDFRETAPGRASPAMFLDGGRYEAERHHNGYRSVGVPGTVAGLHMAWRNHGRLKWERLLDPAIVLARDGFVVSEELARSLEAVLPEMQPYPASVAQFSKRGVPYEAGETLRQPDLARTLLRVSQDGPAAIYRGATARAIDADMAANGGLMTRTDLQSYTAIRRTPLRGTYRGHDVIAMPPSSSGGVGVIGMLQVLEGYDLASMGAGSAAAVHLMAETMKRSFAARARYLGDPAFNPEMPIARLLSLEHAREVRRTISAARAAAASPASFEWPPEGTETTHLSVVDEGRNAVAMTLTLEGGYGSKIVVPGTGFLLNNEMGDFNAGPGLTTADGLIGTAPNLAAPGKRMLSSMAPTILAKNGRLVMVTGSPGGRTIINTVLETIVNVVDFGMNAQEAVDAPRFHHQWLPDRVQYERNGLSPETIAELQRRGHAMLAVAAQGSAQIVVVDEKESRLEGGSDRRSPDGTAIGVEARRPRR
jgi:gamma-glutamyltranspeptidase / glutathione hydrolase